MRRLIVLGSGDAFATGGRHTTSFLLDAEREGYLIDCGVSTLVRLKQINYPISNLRGIFLSHLHGDHFGGVPFVLLSLMFESASNESFFITGPRVVKSKIEELQELMYPGTGSFVQDLGIEFIEYDQKWQRMDDITVKALPVMHDPASSPHGLKFKWNDKMLAFSGDTQWDYNLIELASKTEIFITECNNYERNRPGHLSLNTLEENSSKLDSNRIILSHMGRDVLELKRCPFERLYDGMEIPLW